MLTGLPPDQMWVCRGQHNQGRFIKALAHKPQQLIEMGIHYFETA